MGLEELNREENERMRAIWGKPISECNVKASYTSVFDDCIVCTTACDYNTKTKIVSNIEDAKNSDDAEDANSLTDEYVTLADGTELRESDGVTFEY